MDVALIEVYVYEDFGCYINEFNSNIPFALDYLWGKNLDCLSSIKLSQAIHL